MRRLNVRLLEVFRTVYEAEGVTAASIRLHVTQPAVSKAINQLEAELGTSLFIRVQGRLKPTREADVLYAEYRKLFEGIQSFEHFLQGIGQVPHLGVAAIPALAGFLVAPAATRLREKWPGAKVDIVTAQSADVISEVVHHRVSFGLVHGPVRTSETINEIIGEGEVVAVMAADNHLSKQSTLTPADLKGVPIIQLDQGSPPSHLVREVFKSAGVEMNVVLEVNNSTVAKAVALSGLGVALIDPWSTTTPSSDGLVMRRLSPKVPLRIIMIRSATKPLSSIDKTMMSAVREVLKQHVPDLEATAGE